MVSTSARDGEHVVRNGRDGFNMTIDDNKVRYRYRTKHHRFGIIMDLLSICTNFRYYSWIGLWYNSVIWYNFMQPILNPTRSIGWVSLPLKTNPQKSGPKMSNPLILPSQNIKGGGKQVQN